MADPHHASDDYVRGSQEISEQKQTFDAFMAMSKWGSLWIAALLALLVIWFQPGGSLVGGFITAVVLLVAGWFFLKSGKAKGH
jgi:hypothetical protein